MITDPQGKISKPPLPIGRVIAAGVCVLLAALFVVALLVPLYGFEDPARASFEYYWSGRAVTDDSDIPARPSMYVFGGLLAAALIAGAVALLARRGVTSLMLGAVVIALSCGVAFEAMFFSLISGVTVGYGPRIGAYLLLVGVIAGVAACVLLIVTARQQFVRREPPAVPPQYGYSSYQQYSP